MIGEKTGDKIQRRKLSHEVLDRLRERLRNGEWQQGDHLPSERELMARFGVGRPAIREAMQWLAHSGIIEIAHGDRARVLVPTAQTLIEQVTGGAQHLLRSTPGNLEHLKGARVFLETGLARIAADRARPDDVVRLRRCVQDQAEALSDLNRFLECDMAFHREIAAISGNPIFPAVIEGMFRWAQEFYSTIVSVPGAERLTLVEHERIIHCISAQDSAGAERAMSDHLLRANRLYSELQPG